MMRHPFLYQLNARVYLNERRQELGRLASFEDIEDDLLDQINALGFTWLYLLGAWQTGAAGREFCRSNAQIRAEAQATLPGFRDEDIIGSPFAVHSYEVNPAFGGEAALTRLRERLRQRGIKLMLDFVPNHIASDHEWVASHPEYLIAGSEDDLHREPQNWGSFETPSGRRIFAFGRDPLFSGWADTVQLNYRHPRLRRAMVEQLMCVVEHCDGVRCDMAMLLEPDVFKRTWGDRALPPDGYPPVDRPFWPEAIASVRARHPEHTFMAEVYWDMEWQLQQHGFDFTYDKRLYDRVRAGAAPAVREHLWAEHAFQERSARFLENHDEPRSATVFPANMHRAAALITFLVPGLKFFQEGQLEGLRVRTSVHLAKRPKEKPDPELRAFYDTLLRCLRRPEVHQGNFNLWQPHAAWERNPTWNNFICFSWSDGLRCLLAAVNYAPTQGQCYTTINLDFLSGREFTLSDLLNAARYDRYGDELRTRGLYLDLPSWGYHLFELFTIS